MQINDHFKQNLPRNILLASAFCGKQQSQTDVHVYTMGQQSVLNLRDERGQVLRVTIKLCKDAHDRYFIQTFSQFWREKKMSLIQLDAESYVDT